MRYFSTKERSHYHALQTKFTHDLLKTLLKDPAGFRTHVRRTAASVVLSIAYGYEVADSNDEYVSLLDRVMVHLAKAGIFGAYIVVSRVFFSSDLAL